MGRRRATARRADDIIELHGTRWTNRSCSSSSSATLRYSQQLTLPHLQLSILSRRRSLAQQPFCTCFCPGKPGWRPLWVVGLYHVHQGNYWALWASWRSSAKGSHARWLFAGRSGGSEFRCRASLQRAVLDVLSAAPASTVRQRFHARGGCILTLYGPNLQGALPLGRSATGLWHQRWQLHPSSQCRRTSPCVTGLEFRYATPEPERPPRASELDNLDYSAGHCGADRLE